MRKHLDILLTFGLALVVTIIMLLPLEALPTALPGIDKLAHLISFGMLTFPLARTGRIGLIAVFIGAIAFGAQVGSCSLLEISSSLALPSTSQ